MADAEISVYPREGTTYPDATGTPVTSAGATVFTSKYIRDAIRAGFLLTWDPLGVYLPEDRTGTGTPGGDALAFDTASALGGFLGTLGGQVATTTGCLSRGDGGGGQWYWDIGSASTANTGTIVGASPAGRWKRIYNGPVFARWFGATGNGTTDDTAALQAFLNAIPSGGSGAIDPGVYKITSSLYVDHDEVQISAAPSTLVANGVKLSWAGGPSGYAVYVTGYAQNISGVNIVCTAPLFGGFHVGAVAGHTGVINSRCQLKDCSVLAYPGVSDPAIQFGFGVATVDTVSGNQDFNFFENCVAQNCEQAGWWVDGTPNVIQTTWRRCVILNTMGAPGNKMYVARGMGDGALHPYGIGIRLDHANGVDIDGINFAYLETGLKRSKPDGTPTNAVNYDRVCNIDSEHIKKLAYYRVAGPFGTLAVEGGRVSTTELGARSLGPDGPGGTGYLSSDHEILVLDGPAITLSNLGLFVGDNSVKFDDCISMGLGQLTCVGCTFPSHRPFKGNTVARIVSWGCVGPDGGSPFVAFSKVLDGAYRIQAGGLHDPVHFDIMQSYSKVNLYTPDTVVSTAPQSADASVPDYYRSSPGTVTISGASTSAPAFLNTGEFDANYPIVLELISYTGTPAAGSLTAVAKNKITDRFDATVPVAPGVGASVTFRFFMPNDANI